MKGGKNKMMTEREDAKPPVEQAHPTAQLPEPIPSQENNALSQDWVKWWIGDEIRKLEDKREDKEDKRRQSRRDTWKWGLSFAAGLIAALAGYLASVKSNFDNDLATIQKLKNQYRALEQFSNLRSPIEDSLRLARILDKNRSQLELPSVPLGTVVMVERIIAKQWLPVAEDPDNADAPDYTSLFWAKIESDRKYEGTDFGKLGEKDPLRVKVNEIASKNLTGPKNGNETPFVFYVRIKGQRL